MPTVHELAPAETVRAHRALAELRPAFDDDLDRFLAQVATQRHAGYRLYATFAGDESDAAEDAAAVAGFREVTTLAWGHVVYLDDLSTRVPYRRQGHGAVLLAAVVDEARRLGCDAVHLDSGHQRYDAHRLYLAAGFEIRSHHLSLSLR